MPVHDWTRVDAGIFHDFHQTWMPEIKRALNGGRLPADYYALVEQAPPQVQFRQKSERDACAAKASTLVVRHVSGHRAVAVLEVVSPGNKGSRYELDQFVKKAVEMVRAGIHLLVVDLFPAGPRDAEGIHKAIWDELVDNQFALPEERRLTLASYAAGDYPESFVQPVALGITLPDMPLFLSPDVYVPVPLEATYQAAWETMPAFWREVLEEQRD
jgi:hypothetical protein